MRFYFFFLFTLLVSCTSQPQHEKGNNGAFAKAKKTEEVNLNRIVNSGELIITTISGPDTYFDYQGIAMGLQYALAENFANSLGVGIRVELCNDTTELVHKLVNGDADLIALQLPQSACDSLGVLAAGVFNPKAHTTWAIKPGADDLAQALNDWYGDDIELVIKKKEIKRIDNRRHISRHVRAPFISREKGIISIYDAKFKEAALHTGWDWKLIAAQCYQESGFDPNAISWAGAKGLMQIMPSTARTLNIPDSKIFSPADNIAGAARYIKRLQDRFSEIRNPEEKVKFVLASYNGGAGHIKDAQALTVKHGGNPHRWADVSQYVLKLSQPRYYRDPLVQYGYMIGDETYNYVQNIMQRWKQYGGRVHDLTGPAGGTSTDGFRGDNLSKRSRHKTNRFSKEQDIQDLDDLRSAEP